MNIVYRRKIKNRKKKKNNLRKKITINYICCIIFKIFSRESFSVKMNHAFDERLYFRGRNKKFRNHFPFSINFLKLFQLPCFCSPFLTTREFLTACTLKLSYLYWAGFKFENEALMQQRVSCITNSQPFKQNLKSGSNPTHGMRSAIMRLSCFRHSTIP